MRNQNKRDHAYQVELTKFRRHKEQLQEEVKKCEKNFELKKKEVDSPKSLLFTFGININNRNDDGLFIYNCNRLILMHEPTQQQKKNEREFRGIVGVVNVPYYVNFNLFSERQSK